MRIEDSVRDTVVFLGYPTDDPAKGGCVGSIISAMGRVVGRDLT
jgi:hypothetical protein